MYDITSSGACAPCVPTVTAPDLDSFARVDSLGLVITGQQVWPDKSVLICVPREGDGCCPVCGRAGLVVDHVERMFTHLPMGRMATWLRVRLPRYRCGQCRKVWRHRLRATARAGSKLTRAADWWALCQVVMDHAPISAVAAVLGVSWCAAHNAIAEVAQTVLIDNPERLDGVRVLGVDEHCWRHTRKGDKYVTVVIDLTPVRDQTGPARLLDLVPGRSKAVFAAWIDAQPHSWRDQVEVVAMDGFTGFKTASVEHLPDAVEVMDPFHVVALAGDGLDRCRQRLQQETLGHRGRTGDPLYQSRLTLHTGQPLLTDNQRTRLEVLFTDARHAPVKAMWGVYQRILAAYRDPDRLRGRTSMKQLIDTISGLVPKGFIEIKRLGRTMKRRSGDILAYFNHPRTSNGPTEAINGRLEHLRGTALGFRNLANYRLRSLLALLG